MCGGGTLAQAGMAATAFPSCAVVHAALAPSPPLSPSSGSHGLVVGLIESRVKRNFQFNFRAPANERGEGTGDSCQENTLTPLLWVAEPRAGTAVRSTTEELTARPREPDPVPALRAAASPTKALDQAQGPHRCTHGHVPEQWPVQCAGWRPREDNLTRQSPRRAGADPPGMEQGNLQGSPHTQTGLTGTLPHQHGALESTQLGSSCKCSHSGSALSTLSIVSGQLNSKWLTQKTEVTEKPRRQLQARLGPGAEAIIQGPVSPPATFPLAPVSWALPSRGRAGVAIHAHAVPRWSKGEGGGLLTAAAPISGPHSGRRGAAVASRAPVGRAVVVAEEGKLCSRSVNL